MKIAISFRKTSQTGSALALTVVMTGIALLILAGTMTWSANSTRLTYRYMQYNQSVAAAEAATEKVVSRMTQDFFSYGEQLVVNNLGSYQQTVPTPSDSAFWGGWEFNDGNGNINQTYVRRTTASSYVVLGSTMAGLRGYASTYAVVSHARDTAALQNVVGGVLQEVQLVRIPIFQFAVFYNMDMEISPGADMTVNGPVHVNGNMYTSPSSTLTFYGFVGLSGQLYRKRNNNDPQANGYGPVNFYAGYETGENVLSLPIGTSNNNPTNLAASVLDPSPAGEDPNSVAGQARFANTADIVVSNSAVGSTNIVVFFQDANLVPRLSFVTGDVTIMTTNGVAVTTNNYYSFVTNVSFYDYREGKTVNAVQLDVGKLNTWLTNRSATGGKNYNGQNSIDKGHGINSVYIINNQPASSSVLPAARAANGARLPSDGLTIATPQPLYVLNDYNCPASAGTTNTAGTAPAALIGDAVTILSDSWSDSYTSGTSLNSRSASSTTVNAAMFTGIIPSQTVSGTKHFSGGVENFPRFLEDWNGDTLTYNGSMVAMFYSRYATSFWQSPGVYYKPPNRDWAFDLNFNDPTKLPPQTPSLQELIRSRWATVAPDKNVATPVN